MQLRLDRLDLEASRSAEDPAIRADLAQCLSTAFSSGLWSKTPMPIGSPGDSDSALGVLSGLGDHSSVVTARMAMPDRADRTGDVAGCVVGSVLDACTIGSYGLEAFGARPGDGLLAFIGILPALQGSRVRAQRPGLLRLADGPSEAPTVSLARLLFDAWMEMPRIRSCPQLFIRTRHQIKEIIHLSRSFGFAYCGKFAMEFRGQSQDRLVFSRPRLAIAA